MPRSRIRELRTVRAGDLIPDERNWRRHPEGQRHALSAMLERIGHADAILARETDEGLVIIDGHLRSDLDPEEQVPVLITDLDKEEAGQVLATLDPLASMAETDSEALDNLLNEVGEIDPLIDGLLNDLVDDATWTYEPEEEPDEDPPDELERLFRIKCPSEDGEKMREVLDKVVSKFKGATLS